MTDIAVIILVGREKLHIRRCLEKVQPLEPRQVFVVESQPIDGTHEIAVEMCAITTFNKWPGLYAKQFNWALDNLPIESKWVLRLDADEYLTEETIVKLKTALSDGSLDNVDGLTLEFKRRFMGGEICHGTNGIRLLRIWRYGKGRLEDRAMDEHAQVNGTVVDFDGAFYDDNLNTFEWWKEKHRGYAKREAADAIDLYSRMLKGEAKGEVGDSAAAKKKMAYYRLPPYFRAVAYFCIRYFLKLGFLDGRAGWRWHFWQGLWYRWIVDREIGRAKRGGLVSSF